MKIKIDNLLDTKISEMNIYDEKYFIPKGNINLENIKILMINECPPQIEEDYVYSDNPEGENITTIRMLFEKAGLYIENVENLFDHGIFITTAIKVPKKEYAVPREQILKELSILETEIEIFPNLEVIMLMGDVAKKAFNAYSKKNTKRNCIPSGSTYKIRNTDFYYEDIRVMPSYIMTGKNLRIEKSKITMISEDIAKAIDLCGIERCQDE